MMHCLRCGAELSDEEIRHQVDLDGWCQYCDDEYWETNDEDSYEWGFDDDEDWYSYTSLGT